MAKAKPNPKASSSSKGKDSSDDTLKVEPKTSPEVDQERTVEDKLIALCRLQDAFSQIDRIKTLRGELPLEVKDLEDEVEGMETRLANFMTDNKTLSKTVADEKAKSEKSKELLERYRAQLDQVRNNREFDNLSKEIEFQELEIQLSEKKAREANAEIAARKQQITALKEQLDGRKQDLVAKKGELDTIISETKSEEEQLRAEAKKLEETIEGRILTAFKRIRKGTRNGLGLVPVDRDACGGCFNKVPPQRQLDVKLHKKIIICEYCGRIMVDPELLEEALAK